MEHDDVVPETTVVTVTAWTSESGASALRRFAPAVADMLDRLVALVPTIGGGPVTNSASTRQAALALPG